mmetsp:Transcript_33384/g.93687  ORF Transcript_33384/g.93687 Transcript_33384/m.93687 type:complete len:241 (-) Transcript_33384:1099-1821(-)
MQQIAPKMKANACQNWSYTLELVEVLLQLLREPLAFRLVVFRNARREHLQLCSCNVQQRLHVLRVRRERTAIKRQGLLQVAFCGLRLPIPQRLECLTVVEIPFRVHRYIHLLFLYHNSLEVRQREGQLTFLDTVIPSVQCIQRLLVERFEHVRLQLHGENLNETPEKNRKAGCGCLGNSARNDGPELAGAELLSLDQHLALHVAWEPRRADHGLRAFQLPVIEKAKVLPQLALCVTEEGV